MSTQSSAAVVKPLFGRTELFPLGGVGGVIHAIPNSPGTLRPFVSTLAVPMPPVTKKHDTPNTAKGTRNSQVTSKDGQSDRINVPDQSVDS